MSRRAALSAQLAQLQGPTFDPDASDNLDGLRSGNGDEEEDEGRRDHYLAVGPSRLKGQLGLMAGGDKEGRYGGEVRGRQKIFDDDDDEEEEEEGQEEGEESGGEGGDGSELEDDEDDEDEGEEEDDEQDGEEDDEDEEDGDEDEADQAEDEDEPMPAPSTSSKTLDPIAALRDSRQKDILKGQAIRRQQTLFESLLTIRITYQKALTALSKLPSSPPTDLSDEVSSACSDVLASLGELSEGMFEIRQGITLPGIEVSEGLGKRKREEGDVQGVNYWLGAAKESLDLNDSMREHMLPILNKWSTKIQAATLSLGGKTAGSSKFLQGTKGQMGVVEAIDAGLANRRNPGPQSLLQLEETHYRTLLREIIDSRTSGAQSHMPDTSYRLEKKKKRDAERGASKGRKIRYTVHDKAANFAVPMEIQYGWGESQVDELFGSLLGGAGMSGARSEGGPGAGGLEGMGGGVGIGEGLSGLGGLRVF